MRAVLTSLFACVALAVPSASASAQTPAGVVAASGASMSRTVSAPHAAPCAYVDCALRLEQGRGLVRGATGKTIGTFGFFHSSAVDSLLLGPDSAAAYARSYNSERRTGRLYLITGSALGLGSSMYYSASHRGLGLNLVGLAAMTVATIPASHHFGRASRDLSRSVWWYNAALVDSTSRR